MPAKCKGSPSCSSLTANGNGQRDNGTTGQRDNGTTGQRDNGTTGQRDNGTTGQRDGQYRTHPLHCRYTTTTTTLPLHCRYHCHYNYNYNYTTAYHTTSSSCGWGDHCNHSKNHDSNQLLVHQWIRSAIHASQPLTPPIVSYLWNLRHRRVRYQ